MSSKISRKHNRFLWKLAQISAFLETLNAHFLIYGRNFFLKTFVTDSANYTL